MVKLRNITLPLLLLSNMLVSSACEKKSAEEDEQKTETEIIVEDREVINTEVSFD